MVSSPFLTNKRQLGIKLEAVAGTAETLASADYDMNVGELNYKVTPTRSARGLAQGTHSKLPDLKGGAEVSITGIVELTGHNSGVGTAPAFEKLFRIAGVRAGALRSLTISTITAGPFRHGEIVVQTTSAARGIVVRDTYTGTTTLRVQVIQGTFTTTGGHTLTGQTSGATCAAPSAVAGAADARGYWPVTQDTYALTLSASSGALAVGSEILGGTSGARGVVVIDAVAAASLGCYVRMISGTFQAEALSSGGWTGTASASTVEDVPTATVELRTGAKVVKATGCRATFSMPLRSNNHVRIPFTIRGILVSESDGALLAEGALKTSKVPPVLRSSALQIISGGTTWLDALVDAIEIEHGNRVELRQSANGSQGFAPAVIVDRSSTARLAVDHVAATVFPIPTLDTVGSTVRIEFTLGSAAANTFDFQFPQAQITDRSSGERDGVQTEELQLQLGGGGYSTGNSNEGQNCEWVMVLR